MFAFYWVHMPPRQGLGRRGRTYFVHGTRHDCRQAFGLLGLTVSDFTLWGDGTTAAEVEHAAREAARRWGVGCSEAPEIITAATFAARYAPHPPPETPRCLPSSVSPDPHQIPPPKPAGTPTPAPEAAPCRASSATPTPSPGSTPAPLPKDSAPTSSA